MNIKELIEDLRLNHEYCPKEVILHAADAIEQLSKKEWVGLTQDEIETLIRRYVGDPWTLIDEVAVKLEEKNT